MLKFKDYIRKDVDWMQEQLDDYICKDAVLLIQDFAWGPTRTTTTSADWDAAIHNAHDFKTRLRHACSHGHTAIADWVLAQAQQSDVAIDLVSPLMDAYKNGHLATAKCLVAQGATNVNRALHNACRRGHLATAKWLVTQGATDFDCALHNACRGGHRATAKWLVVQGATYFDGALKDACRGGHLATAKWLVTQGATDFDGASYVAYEYGWLATAQWLATQGATALTADMWNVLEYTHTLRYGNRKSWLCPC